MNATTGMSEFYDLLLAIQDYGKPLKRAYVAVANRASDKDAIHELALRVPSMYDAIVLDSSCRHSGNIPASAIDHDIHDRLGRYFAPQALNRRLTAMGSLVSEPEMGPALFRFA